MPNHKRRVLSALSAATWAGVAAATLVSPVLAQSTPPASPGEALPQAPEASPYGSPALPSEPAPLVTNDELPPPPERLSASAADSTLEPPPLEPQAARRGPVSEGSFMLGVPIWFTPDRGIVQPGVGFEARIARRFGLVAPELTVGWQINWIDEDKLRQELRNYNLTIDSLYISAGARVYALREAPVTPFISGAFDLSFWHLTGSGGLACGYYYCDTSATYDVSVGISGRLGVAFMPSERLQIEAGARIAMVFAVGPFEDVEAWVSPFLGFTARI